MKGWLAGIWMMFVAFAFFVDYMAALSKYECYQRDWLDWMFVISIAGIGFLTLLRGLEDRK